MTEYRDGLIIKILDGDILNIADESSKVFSARTYANAVIALNKTSGVSQTPLGFIPTKAMAGLRLDVDSSGMIPLIEEDYPVAVMPWWFYDVATNENMFFVQTSHGWGPCMTTMIVPDGDLVALNNSELNNPVNSLSNYGISTGNGVVSLDVLSNYPAPPGGIPASALIPGENANPIAMLYCIAGQMSGLSGLVYSGSEYMLTVDVPLLGAPIVIGSVLNSTGTARALSVTSSTASEIRFKLFNSSGTTVQDDLNFSILVIGLRGL